MPQVSASIQGQLTIGDDAHHISIPLSAEYPSKNGATSNYYKFDFEADPNNLDAAPKIPVGDFLNWVTSKVGLSGQLPDSLKSLEVLANKVKLDTSANLDLAVMVGSETTGPTPHFQNSWEVFSIGSATFSLDNLQIRVSYGEFPPIIDSITPETGAVGATVTITGEELGEATAVDFGTIPATIASKTATTITVTVPTGATTGPIKVTTPAGTVDSATFTVS